jgi:hypothetical protein
MSCLGGRGLCSILPSARDQGAEGIPARAKLPAIERHGRADRRFGTFLPFLRASARPIAMACLRLLTVLRPLPLFSVPFLRLRMAPRTSLEAPREYRRTIGLFLHWFHVNMKREFCSASSAPMPTRLAAEAPFTERTCASVRLPPGFARTGDERCGAAQGMPYRTFQTSEIHRSCGLGNGVALRLSRAPLSCLRCCSRSNVSDTRRHL